jgi:hypothetical protein
MDYLEKLKKDLEKEKEERDKKHKLPSGCAIGPFGRIYDLSNPNDLVAYLEDSDICN